MEGKFDQLRDVTDARDMNINYRHLRYFWMVAREGSVTRAAEKLHLTQPAVSTQVRSLERALGEQLLTKSGRNVVLTDVGRIVYQYAEDIFALGQELRETLRGRPGERALRFVVGMSDAIPKLIAYHLLEPALHLDTPVHLVVREGKLDRLLADLAIHTVDLVLSDAPIPVGVSVQGHSHPLGECGVAFLAAPRLARALREGFPGSLEGAPLILPTPNTTLRRALNTWLDGEGIQPEIVAEIEDSAVVKVFGQAGVGAFVVPDVIEREVREQYEVERVGRLGEAVRETFYAISVERKIEHPAVQAIARAARSDLFAGS